MERINLTWKSVKLQRKRKLRRKSKSLSLHLANNNIIITYQFYRSLVINLTHCRYDSGNVYNILLNHYIIIIIILVRRVARRCGLQPVVGENDDWTVYWVDTSIMMERVMDMKRYQVCVIFWGIMDHCFIVSVEDKPFPWHGRDMS